MPPRAPVAAFALLGLLGISSCLDPDPAPALARLELAAPDRDGTARGFPEMRSLDGKTVDKGEFAQSADGTVLRMRVRYNSALTLHGGGGDDRQVPALVQETWSWREIRGGEVQRRFEIDFRSGDTPAEKREKGRCAGGRSTSTSSLDEPSRERATRSPSEASATGSCAERRSSSRASASRRNRRSASPRSRTWASTASRCPIASSPPSTS